MNGNGTHRGLPDDGTARSRTAGQHLTWTIVMVRDRPELMRERLLLTDGDCMYVVVAGARRGGERWWRLRNVTPGHGREGKEHDYREADIAQELSYVYGRERRQTAPLHFRDRPAHWPALGAPKMAPAGIIGR